MKYITDEQFEQLKHDDMNQKNKHEGKNIDSTYSNNRKCQQRMMNRLIRRFNTIMKTDYLWRSRFFIRQAPYQQLVRFKDGSGSDLFVTLRLYDKKYNIYYEFADSVASLCFRGGGRLFWKANDIIVNDFYVWNDDNYKDRIDYQSIPEDETVYKSKNIRQNR